MACIEMDKALEACEKIKRESNSNTVYVEKIDLACFDSIREFVSNFKSKYKRLDILINNAGELTVKDWCARLLRMVNFSQT